MAVSLAKGLLGGCWRPKFVRVESFIKVHEDKAGGLRLGRLSRKQS